MTINRPEPGRRVEPAVVTPADEINVVNRYTSLSAPRDRVRWGPILAGLLTALTALVLLTVLGLALGASVFEPTSEGEDVGTFAVIYAAISGLIAFFLGGWMARRTAAVRRNENAALNGFLVGATVLAAILWLTSAGLGNVLGGISNNIGDIARIGRDEVQSGQVDPNQVQGAVQNAADRARQTAIESYDDARNSAWGTLGGLVLALGAATLGGFVGHKAKTDEGDPATESRA